VETTDATLLRLTRLTDTSWIVHWFTEGFGLIKTVAKGARRPGSPFAGSLDLFFGGDIVFQHARRGSLHQLREVAVHSWRGSLRESYDSVLLSGYFCRLLEEAVEPEHPEPALHDLLKRALDHLATQPAGLRALLHFEKELARILGITHRDRPAAGSLQETLGRLPECRTDLVKRLASPLSFDSSNGGTG
jgi:DNA repair protein RecO (recombination protein O)